MVYCTGTLVKPRNLSLTCSSLRLARRLARRSEAAWSLESPLEALRADGLSLFWV